MNIAIYCRPFYPSVGGMERVAAILAQEFSRMGACVELFTETPADQTDDPRCPYKVNRNYGLWRLVKGFRKADVMLFMGVSLRGLPAAILSGRTIILSHHGGYVSTTRKGQLLEEAKLWLTRFFFNVSISEFVKRRVTGSGVVIHNPYDDRLFVASREQTRTGDFVFVGRLVSDKGCHFLLNAFRHVLDVKADATLTIVGDGPERVHLEAQAKQLDIDRQVRFTGVLKGEELVSEMSVHRCAVVPSLWDEPFGLVALEGLACCGRVVVTARGGLPEAVGEFGMVAPVVETDFAQTMLRALAEAAHTGADLDRFLEQHSAATVAATYYRVLSSRGKHK